MGFFSSAKRVLFVGDAFAMSWRVALPPDFLNTDRAKMRASFAKLARYDAAQLVPAHYFALPADAPARVRRKIERLGLNA